MARDHARIRLDIWTDDDWRDLSAGAQWLYMRLLSHGGLSFAGVVEWRPGRLAAGAADLRAADVEMYACELLAGRFVLIDAGTEECLIRSFVKHDGLMRSPNMAAAFVKAHAAVESKAIRGVVVHELGRLYDAQADLRGFTRTDVRRVLDKAATTFDEAFETLRETLPETLRSTLPEPLPIAPPETVNPSESNPSRNPSVTPTPSPCSLSNSPPSVTAPPTRSGSATARAAIKSTRKAAQR